MKTEFEILRLLEDDLRGAARHERLVGARATRRARRSGWGTVAASFVAILVVAGLIGMVAKGGLGGSSDDAGAGAERAVGAAAGAGGETGGAVEEAGQAPAAQPTPRRGSRRPRTI